MAGGHWRWLALSLLVLLAPALEAGERQQGDVRSPPPPPTRVRDLVRVEAWDRHTLKGLGLVVGLPGTGDDARAALSRELLGNLLEHLRLPVPLDDLGSRNVAVVMVTASVNAGSPAGAPLEVTVSSLGDARSLRGGVLLETLLYEPGSLLTSELPARAVAQGPVRVSDSPTAGTAPATLRLPLEAPGGPVRFTLMLARTGLSRAQAVARAVRAAPHAPEGTLVEVIDPGRVRLTLDGRSRARALAWLENALEENACDPAPAGRVVVSDPEGIVLIQGEVRVAPVVLRLDDLTIHLPRRGETLREPPHLAEVLAALEDEGVPARRWPSIVDALDEAGALLGTLVRERER